MRKGNNIMKGSAGKYIMALSLFCFLALGPNLKVSGQEFNAPYSRFGLGDLSNPNFMLTRSMGGLGTAYADVYTLNPVNPASYSFLNLASYDVGFNAEYARISDSEASEDRWKGNLEYLGLAFPLRNYKNSILDPKKKKFKFGMAFFLKPYSNVSYDVTNLEEVDNIGRVQRRFTGDGGTYNIGWGNSVKYKDLSIGLNLGYIFGNISNRQRLTLLDDLVALQDQVESEYSIRAFDYQLGMLYQIVLNKKAMEAKKTIPEQKILIGLRGKSATGFNTRGSQSHFGLSLVTQLRDTIILNQSISGTGTLPATVGFGVTYFKGRRWTLGLDGEYTLWSNFSNTIRPEQTFNNSYRVAFGGKYRPDERGFGTFLERTSYTFGAYYQADPRIILGDDIVNYGLNLGMSLPFFYQQNFSSVQLSFDLGRRGVGSIIDENFIQLGVGMNFNDDSWFIQRKYN